MQPPLPPLDERRDVRKAMGAFVEECLLAHAGRSEAVSVREARTRWSIATTPLKRKDPEQEPAPLSP
jgi:hypothetical protein